ncbi:hypothetical protein GCM10010387_35160 [Streptomyces inusitatus]|uniref:Uncharacterized protein n=1 Tax=Streptomyces inusitatus TaxID=68221 RepID=A0A918QAG4_9ACTN|nr:hypothetical protein [Streptomyces inusitatus]GGZ38076.1 hypothetical protein GCM10010387_35160 [Streptomyces inusitatus]
MTDFTDAGEALDRAAETEAETRRRADWYTRYLMVFAAGQLVLVPMALLWKGLLAALVFAVLNLLLMAGLSVYAARQRAVLRGFGARHGSVIGGWAAAFALAIALGTSAYEGSVGFAAVAAVWCALPPATAAWGGRRRAAAA